MYALSLGFSPCPNDTFIFDALVNKQLDTGELRFDYVMEDVETLNQWAFEGKLAITKLSYHTFLHVSDRYALLDAGSALGSGVGPLLITRAGGIPSRGFEDFINRASVAIPGQYTTANLLFSLAFPEAKNKTEVLFSEIEERVLQGEFDCGLVIHESRFTYRQKGLQKLMDMGEWWEKSTGAAIPLGGICIRRDLLPEIAGTLNRLIRESLALSWQHYPVLSDFVKNNAQEMEEAVMRQHIDLYVNKYTNSLGVEGRQAVQALLERAQMSKLIIHLPQNIYG